MDERTSNAEQSEKKNRGIESGEYGVGMRKKSSDFWLKLNRKIQNE